LVKSSFERFGLNQPHFLKDKNKIREVKAIDSSSRVIGEKYQLLRQIGRGGNGCVYLAQDYRLGKYWAIKELSKEHEIKQLEVNVLKKLTHPMLPRITDRLEEADKVYIVMDYLPGITLEQLQRQGKKFRMGQIVEWSIQLCEVFAYLHGRNPQVIYRDLKPGNLILTREGELKLVDFGCACFYLQGKKVRQTFVGSPDFAAPEQYGGESTPLTDVFGIGATLEALCGSQRIPKGMKQIIRKCKKKNPRKRYKSIEVLKKELVRIKDETRRQRYTRKICMLLLLIVCFFGLLQGILKRAQEKFYYARIEQEEYEDAIEVFPDREWPYLCLLEQYAKEGDTRKGIEKVEHYRLLYPEETAYHQKVLQNIGKLYFAGNVLDMDFGIDYEMAYRYFEKVASEQESEESDIDCYRRMAASLCKFGNEIDWKAMKEDLEYMEGLAFKSADRLVQIQQYQMIAAVYLANRHYFENDGIEAADKAIALLELCEELIETENQSGVNMQLSVEIRMSLADACYTKGMQDKQSTLLEKSCRLYETILPRLTDLALRRRIMLNLAYIKRDSGLLEEAAGWYEELIKENPNDVDGYCFYALMKLLDEEDMEKTKELYLKAGRIKGADKNQNYQVLKKRMEVLE